LVGTGLGFGLSIVAVVHYADLNGLNNPQWQAIVYGTQYSLNPDDLSPLHCSIGMRVVELSFKVPFYETSLKQSILQLVS
jgi:hypothetical protein